MADPEELHEVLRNTEEFGKLLEELDRPENVDELRARVEAWGNQVAKTYDATLEEVHDQEVGLIRLAWEAHHEKDGSEKLETYR